MNRDMHSNLTKSSQQLRCYASGERALLKLLGGDSLGLTAKLGARLLSGHESTIAPRLPQEYGTRCACTFALRSHI